MKAVTIESESYVLPLWAQDKFREILMLCNTKGPARLELSKGQSLYFSEDNTLNGPEGFIELPRKRSILKLMYLGDNAWCKYDSVGEFNIIKKEFKDGYHGRQKC